MLSEIDEEDLLFLVNCVGKPILEALQGGSTFLFRGHENINWISVSSCMSFRAFYALILPWGNLEYCVLQISFHATKVLSALIANFIWWFMSLAL